MTIFLFLSPLSILFGFPFLKYRKKLRMATSPAKYPGWAWPYIVIKWKGQQQIDVKYYFDFAGPKAVEISNMNLRPAGRFAYCSETSISALLESFGVGTSFSNETRLSMEHENPMESFPNNFRVPQAFCVTPEITCLPSESATSLSESSKSSVTLQLVQETTFTKKEGRKIFDVQPQARYESFKDVPGSTCCTSCGIRVLTYTEYRVSSATWALAGLLCAFGCHFGCCLIPFFIKSFKDVIHLCPLCKTQLGRFTQVWIKVPYSAAETTTKVSEPENGPKIFVSRPHPITLADLSTFLRVVVSIGLSMLF